MDREGLVDSGRSQRVRPRLGAKTKGPLYVNSFPLLFLKFSRVCFDFRQFVIVCLIEDLCEGIFWEFMSFLNWMSKFLPRFWKFSAIIIFLNFIYLFWLYLGLRCRGLSASHGEQGTLGCSTWAAVWWLLLVVMDRTCSCCTWAQYLWSQTLEHRLSQLWPLEAWLLCGM